jgi:ABC-type polysaccharide/polyol phosphate transport system ATPase subunit
MTAPSIELDNVGKRYSKLTDRVIGSGIGLYRRTRREDFWALRGVDLTVDKGESIAIVGRNGSGKSTLLSMLAAVSAPSEGRVVVRGRIAPLLSVGVGFHPEITGRENVFVNGAVLGMSRTEIIRRFDEIVAFAGVEKFLDTPVKFYSSGMFVRLGFAVAVNATPDVLLVDEVLAVGDLAFQVKCFDRMRELQAQGTTLVLVTHNLQAMEVMCDRGVVIDTGALRFDGGVHAAIGHYHQLLSDDPTTGIERAPASSRVLAIEMTHPDGTPATSLPSGSDVVVKVEVEHQTAGMDPELRLVIADDSTEVYAESIPWSRLGLGDRSRGTVTVRLALPLTTGTYSVRATLAPEGSVVGEDETIPPTFFRVTVDRPVNGVADLAATCTVTEL